MTYQSLIVAKCVNLITDDFLKELIVLLLLLKETLSQSIDYELSKYELLLCMND